MNKRLGEDFKSFCGSQYNYGLTHWECDNAKDYIKDGVLYSTKVNGYYWVNGVKRENAISDSSKVSVSTCKVLSLTDYSEKCDIYFYEWSRVDSGVRHFTNKGSFLKFLEECNITYQNYQLMSSKYTTYYCSCFPRHARLIVRNTFEKLQEILDRYNTLYAERESSLSTSES